MADKKLSIREEAKQAILAGGSYLMTVNGTPTVFTAENIDKFPSDAELALGNPDAEALALEDIDAQLKALEEAKKKLTASQKKAETSTKESSDTASTKEATDSSKK